MNPAIPQAWLCTWRDKLGHAIDGDRCTTRRRSLDGTELDTFTSL